MSDGGSELFPVLDPDMLADLAEFGRNRHIAIGETLYRAGDEIWDFFVVISGGVEIVRLDADGPDGQGSEAQGSEAQGSEAQGSEAQGSRAQGPEVGEGPDVVATYSAGQFVGELGLLTGQRPYLTARATRAGTVLVIDHHQFRRLMSTKPAIADIVFKALIARREVLLDGPGARAVRIIGSRYSSEALALRTFAARMRLAHTWIDLEDADDVGQLLATMGLRPGDTPVVVTSTAVLRHPTPGEFAALLGLTYRPVPGRIFDLVVIGAGPAGLAASVYGASEGLDTVTLDATSPGGQAGASSRIENYAGFPNGISGGDLTARTAIQAQRLGAWLVSPCEVAGLEMQQDFHIVTLVDQSQIPCRAVIVATGARYQRLGVPDLERFEGRGVYYAATDLEARSCLDSSVVVVGGGNSAGQAAIYLSQQGIHVTIAVRRPDLAATMSRYLIDRIAADTRIELLVDTQVRALHGDSHLEQVTIEHTPTATSRTIPGAALFCFIGADPATGWLEGLVALDAKGFILTDRSVPGSPARDILFAGRDPLPFETSVPGVFAVGDVRFGSMKRVAAAVGEGSSAVRAIFDYLTVHA